jgi:plasmid stabilization system protein ParE
MISGYEIRWTKRSAQDLQSIIAYLELNWSEKEVRNFVVLLEYHLSLLSRNPLLFKASERYQGSRECLMSRYLTLFYIIEHETVYLVTIWDNRKDPKYIVK